MMTQLDGIEYNATKHEPSLISNSTYFCKCGEHFLTRQGLTNHVIGANEELLDDLESGAKIRSARRKEEPKSFKEIIDEIGDQLISIKG